MFNIAIFGSNSQISKDLIPKLLNNENVYLYLFSTNSELLLKWLKLKKIKKKINILNYDDFFTKSNYDVIINFIGCSDPKYTQILSEEKCIKFKKFDNLILEYLKKNIKCKYIFISSGVAGNLSIKKTFLSDEKFKPEFNYKENNSVYSKMKYDIEKTHRCLNHLSIVDLRVFSYVGQNVNLDSKLFLSQIIKSIKSSKVLTVSPDDFVRDYIHEDDFFSLISQIIKFKPFNGVLDSYSRKPVEKLKLLKSLKLNFNLKYKIEKVKSTFDGHKKYYASNNKSAAGIGYKPKFESEEAILNIIDLIQNEQN